MLLQTDFASEGVLNLVVFHRCTNIVATTDAEAADRLIFAYRRLFREGCIERRQNQL